MTIRKYLGCDGPDCISNLEVELESPLRDILPGSWTAIMIPGDQKQDYHFCSTSCLAKFAIGRTLKDDEDGAAGAGVPVQPKPTPTLDTGALPKAVSAFQQYLRDAMAGFYNPPETYTYTWPDLAKGGGFTLYNQAAGGNWFHGGAAGMAGASSYVDITSGARAGALLR